MKKTELLIPVGNYEMLEAAIYNGADAIYLGGKQFGARAYADNFDYQQLKDAVLFCHKYNVKCYVTVNTMLNNDEFMDAISYLKYLYEIGVDAVILQDIGLIHYTRKNIPLLDVHVSTQAHCHNAILTKYFYDLGCKRVVYDREMSLDSINSIDIPIEKEIFVYGALCICYSGNCLFSALNGGRSANKGMCVGSCRLPYKLLNDNKIVDSGYLLSTKDLNTLPKLKDILDCNIDSLKVEGRMKSKEYVALVTRTFRKMIDDYYASNSVVYNNLDNEKLMKVYNREFTLGYLFNEKSIINKKTSNHQGVPIGKVISVNNKKIGIKLNSDVSQGDAIRFASINKGMYLNCLYNDKGLLVSSLKKNDVCFVDNKDRIMYKDLIDSDVLKTIDVLLSKELNQPVGKKLPLDMKFVGCVGKQIELEVTDGYYKGRAVGSECLTAIKQPVSKEKVIEQLSKLGNTPYYLNDCNILLENNSFINLKDLNQLRRDAILAFEDNKLAINNRIEIKNPVYSVTKSDKQKISILVRNAEQLNVALANNIDFIYVTEYELYLKYKKYDNVYYVLNRVNDSYNDLSGERLLATEFGSLIKYSSNNVVRTDYGFNVANDSTIATLEKNNARGICLSVEMDNHLLSNIKNKKNTEILVYGRPLCMIIKNNIFNINGGKYYLLNDKNQKYPIIAKDNFTYIYNDKTINLLDKISQFKGFGTLRIDLFDENMSDTLKIISMLKNGR